MNSIQVKLNESFLIFTKTHSGYYYGSNCDGKVVSAADNIIDVDEDDVLIIDGLTKRFRLPGWVNPPSPSPPPKPRPTTGLTSMS